MALTKINTSQINGDFSSVGISGNATAFGSGATIIPDLTISNHFTWTINGNKTLNLPATNPGRGMWYILATNDSTGGYTLSLDSTYNIVGGTVYDSTADVTNLITVVSNGSRYDVWFQAFATSFMVPNSVVLNGDDEYLTFTPASTGDTKTWTFSTWVKRSEIASWALYSAAIDTDNRSSIQFGGLHNLQFIHHVGGSNVIQYESDYLFRDSSAWYHIVVQFDSTTDTVDAWVNGVSIGMNATVAMTTNDETYINDTEVHNVGAISVSSIYLNGYMAETVLVDGQALSPTDFGTFNANGKWVPIDVSKTVANYGTNGFYFDYETTGNLGTDISGNGNDYTQVNIAPVNQVVDSPSQNYATLNPNLPGRGANLTNGALRNNQPAAVSVDFNSHATISELTSGKWYWEIEIHGTNFQYPWTGVWSSGAGADRFGNYSTGSTQFRGYGFEFGSSTSVGLVTGDTSRTTNTTAPWNTTFAANDFGMVALDLDNDKIYFGKNGTWLNSGNPAAGTGFASDGLDSTNYSYTPALGVYGSPTTINFGQLGFKYTPPSGFSALQTQNFAVNDIDDPGVQMNVLTYTGDASVRSITGVGFQPDFVWIKNRDQTDDHKLIDVVRGATNKVSSNLFAIESTDANGLTSFDADGFSLGTGADGYNDTGENFVAWCWKAGGAAVANADGSIASSVSANPTSGFSVVTYTGTGANATVGHGLGSTPKFILVKCRTFAYFWEGYHEALGNTDSIRLDTNGAAGTFAAMWNNTSPTATTFSLGTDTGVNANTQTFVSYCWSEIPGFSKFGSYTGNGLADGPFVYLGFQPSFLMVKKTNAVANWEITHNSDGYYNGTGRGLFANLTQAENTAGVYHDLLSNGFKVRTTDGDANTASGTYIYAAFAKHPFAGSDIAPGVAR